MKLSRVTKKSRRSSVTIRIAVRITNARRVARSPTRSAYVILNLLLLEVLPLRPYSLERLILTNKKSAHRFLLVQEDCPRALSVCGSTVRLGRLSSWGYVQLYNSAAGQSEVMDILQKTICDTKFFVVLETPG